MPEKQYEKQILLDALCLTEACIAELMIAERQLGSYVVKGHAVPFETLAL